MWPMMDQSPNLVANKLKNKIFLCLTEKNLLLSFDPLLYRSR